MQKVTSPKLGTNLQGFECYVMGGFPPGDLTFYQTYTTRPFGLSQKIVALSKNSQNYEDMVDHFKSYEELAEWLQIAEAALPTFSLPENVSSFFERHTDERYLIDDYWYAYHVRALTLVNFAQENDRHQPSLLEGNA
jgi:hypothetical protein